MYTATRQKAAGVENPTMQGEAWEHFTIERAAEVHDSHVSMCRTKQETMLALCLQFHGDS